MILRFFISVITLQVAFAFVFFKSTRPLLHRHNVAGGFSENDKRNLEKQRQQQQRPISRSGFVPGSRVYEWKHGWEIHYAQVGEKGPPILLVPGFGVGLFHYMRNMEKLAEDHRVYSIDILGQGKSWMTREPTKEEALALSIELWEEQLIYFIKEYIREPCYIAGNSLGGFLSLGVGSKLGSRWIKGIILLNATPFWAFLPNRKNASSFLKTIIPWDATLPAPSALHKIGASYFDKLRDKRTITTMLSAVYANNKAFDDELIENIMEPTKHRFGGMAFTSILFAPKPEHTFEDYLRMTKDIPMLLLYGKEDPWVMPVWGQRLKRHRNLMTRRTLTEYIELTPAGHTPHHETPTPVNTFIKEWVDIHEAGEEEKKNERLDAWRERSHRVFKDEYTGVEVSATHQNGQPRDFLEWLAATTLFRT